MDRCGLTKLLEELGELAQISAKKSNYMHTDQHPDGNGSMQSRLEDEMAALTSAIDIVVNLLALDEERISQRRLKKYKLFKKWSESEFCDGVRIN